MRRLMFIGLAVILLAGLAGGQATYTKYALGSGVTVFAVGRAVKLGVSDNTCLLTGIGEGSAAVGFIAMIEKDASDDYHNLVVNAGRITARLSVAQVIVIGDELTATGNGALVEAGVGDRVIAIATEAVTTVGDSADIEIMIYMEPIIDENGARKWQVYDAAPDEYDLDGENIFSADLSSSGGVDVKTLDFYFTCTVDDKGTDGSVTGTVAKFTWQITGDISTSIAPGATVYLLDRHFYQSQTVAMQAADMDPELTDNFTVNVKVEEELGIDGTGRITNALLTVVGTPRIGP